MGVLKPGETPAVYVDVDGTLLLWPGPKPGSPGWARERGLSPRINQRLVAILTAWHRPGRFLALWSRGGVAHCRYAADLCGLAPDACLPKPRIAVDDGPRSVTADDHKGFVVLDPVTGALDSILELSGAR